MGGFYVIKRGCVKRGGREYKESKEVREIRDVREVREVREIREIREISSISTTTNFRVRVGLICCRLRERADGTYMAYFPFALWIEVTK